MRGYKITIPAEALAACNESRGIEVLVRDGGAEFDIRPVDGGSMGVRVWTPVEILGGTIETVEV